MTDLVELISTYTPLKKATPTEWQGPCPFCGGTDRFRVWPEPAGTKPHYWCRQCGQRGDAIQFARDYLNKSFVEAREWASGVDLRSASEQIISTEKLSSSSSVITPVITSAVTPPALTVPPSEQWQERANAFVTYGEEQLWSEVGKPVRDELLAGGLTEETVRKARLGWNPGILFDQRERWDLPAKRNRRGRVSRAWLPRGIVFPTWVDGLLWRVLILTRL